AKAVMKSDIANLPETEKPKAIIDRWLCNYAPVFAAIPSEVTAPGCATQNYLAKMKSGLDQTRAKIRNNLGFLAWFVDPMGKITDFVDEKIKPGLWSKIAHELTADGSLAISIANLREDEYDARALQDEFATDKTGAQLLYIA